MITKKIDFNTKHQLKLLNLINLQTQFNLLTNLLTNLVTNIQNGII